MDSNTNDPIERLIDKASQVPLKAGEVTAFADMLPTTDQAIERALNVASSARNEKAFQVIFFSALIAKRPIPATVLVGGVPLFHAAFWLNDTALRTSGHAGEALLAAVESKTLALEREGLCLSLAWIYYAEQGEEFPDALRVATRKHARYCRRHGQILLATYHALILAIDEDPVLLSIFGGQFNLEEAERILRRVKRDALEGDWNPLSLDEEPDGKRVFSGATLKRSEPRVGRNDPCPCGSGKKHKKCCFGKEQGFDSYSSDGVNVAEARQVPELGLTPQKIDEMRSYELWRLRPGKIPKHLAGRVAHELIAFCEFDRAREVLEIIDPNDLHFLEIDGLFYSIYENEKGERPMLRWFLEWADGLVETFFEAELMLADRGEALNMLLAKAEEAFGATKAGDPHARVAYTELAQGAFYVSQPLGILLSRGVLQDAGGIHHDCLLELIEDARDELGLVGEDIAERVSQAIMDDEEITFETKANLASERAAASQEVEKRRHEIDRLEGRIGNLEGKLRSVQEQAAVATSATRRPHKKAPADEAIADAKSTEAEEPSKEEQELVNEIKRLKNTVKEEHSERNRMRRQLRATKDELAAKERVERYGDKDSTDPDSGTNKEDQWLEPMPERMVFRVRVPEFSAGCRQALALQATEISAAAVSLAGRLAAGDKAAWQGSRRLRQLPGLVRQKVGRSHRIFFRSNDETLEFVDLIDRRDFETWIRKQHQM